MDSTTQLVSSSSSSEAPATVAGADRPADFDAVVAAAFEAPLEEGCVVFSNFRSDPEEGWYCGILLRCHAAEDGKASGGQGGTVYDVSYADGDVERGLPRRSVVRGHPWLLRRFVMKVKGARAAKFLRGRLLFGRGVLLPALQDWIYQWKTCAAGRDDQLSFIAE